MVEQKAMVDVVVRLTFKLPYLVSQRILKKIMRLSMNSSVFQGGIFFSSSLNAFPVGSSRKLSSTSHIPQIQRLSYPR